MTDPLQSREGSESDERDGRDILPTRDRLGQLSAGERGRARQPETLLRCPSSE